jgi:hypothetical protein
MIDPTKVLICTPTLDGNVVCGYAGGLTASAGGGMVGNVAFLQGVSHVALARNLMTESFLKAEHFQWQVWIDADIEFTPRDLALLLDINAETLEGAKEENPEGTTLDDEGHALIVTAEYARKVETRTAVRFGLGFTRIHRSVYQRLIDTRDEAGAPRIGQFQHKGQLLNDFYPSGAGFSGIWFSEDTGFFHLVRLAGITPRIEQRTHLKHIGRVAYDYIAPGVGIE